jgi:hypothetical protein
MASERVQAVSTAFPRARKRSKLTENTLRAALVEGNGSPSLNPCDACRLAGVICWVSSDSSKCSFCLHKNCSCSGSAEREFVELVQAHRLLNDKIDQAQARVDDAFTNLEAASKELQTLRQQKKSLTLNGSISGIRAPHTVNAGLVQQVPASNPLTEPFNSLTESFGFLPPLLPEDMDPLFAQLTDSNS